MKSQLTKREQIYRSLDALEPVKRVLADASHAIDDKSRTIRTSEIPAVLGGVAAGSAGVGIGLVLINTAGVAGFSAAGITSGLATLGVVAGGGMLAGIFVAGAPMAILGMAGYGAVATRNRHVLAQAKEAAFQDAVRKQDAILRELNDRVTLSQERTEYLLTLNARLEEIISNLKADLGI
jgi:hypothetical protein